MLTYLLSFFKNFKFIVMLFSILISLGLLAYILFLHSEIDKKNTSINNLTTSTNLLQKTIEEQNVKFLAQQDIISSYQKAQDEIKHYDKATEDSLTMTQGNITSMPSKSSPEVIKSLNKILDCEIDNFEKPLVDCQKSITNKRSNKVSNRKSKKSK